jgi:hypothetical protein
LQEKISQENRSDAGGKSHKVKVDEKRRIVGYDKVLAN